MKYLVIILTIGLTITIYMLTKQYYELYNYKNVVGIGNCLIKQDTAEKFIKNYQDHFSIDSNKTKSIWFSEDIVRCLYINLIHEDKKDTVDGFRIYLATYTKDDCPAVSSAKNPIANTVIFVPTSPDSTGKKHKDLWNLINREKEVARAPYKFEVPNHGELCPNACN